jgi:hypothetical protein
VRTLILLLATLTCGIAGYFAGGNFFDAAHPAALPAPMPVGDPLRSLQSAQAGVTAALDRHRARQSWINVGTGTGLAVGFLGTVLAYKAFARRVPPRVEVP